MLHLKPYLLAMFISMAASVSAQRLPFINYTPAEGLINNRVRSIYQDSKGRMYFLTFEGLSVYDGARFINYSRGEGLANELVNDMLEVSPDSFLVATNTNQFNCLVKGKIQPLHTSDGFYPIINSFFKSRDGTIYVAADDGLFIWKHHQFNPLPFLYNGKNAGRFLVQIKEVGSLLLILINPEISEDAGELLLYDPTKQRILAVEKKFLTYHTDIGPGGDIWLGTNHGLRVLRKEALLSGNILDEDVPAVFAPLKNKKISFLKFDNQGQLWVSIYGEGLFFIKPGANLVRYDESSGLGSTIISYIFQDREGNNWFLPEGKGVQKLANSNVEFSDHPFSNAVLNDLFAEPGSDSTWLYDGVGGQLILLSGSLKKIFSLPCPPLTHGHLLVRASSLWLYNEKSIYKLIVPASGTSALSAGSFKDSSFEAGYGIIDWSGSLIYCADNQLKVFTGNKASFTLPVDYFTDQLSLDQKGNLWIATRSNKLQVFTLHPEDPSQYLQLRYDLSSQMHLQNPRSLAVDDSGRIWIGTRYDGLYCFSFSKDRLTQLQHLTRKKGLTDDFIKYLSCGHHNDIWAGSPSGLDKIETDSMAPVILNITRSSRLFQSIKKVMTDRNNTSWALGESGYLLKVYPATIKNAGFIPSLYIAQIRSGTRLFTDADSIHEFSFRQNNLSFSVAAPSFYDEKLVTYSYLLSGSGNDQWSEPSANAELNFVNLAPGRYTLKVKASFPVGRYPEQVFSYSFGIKPPWWETWWFRSLLGLFVAALIILVVRNYYQRKLRIQQSALEKQQAVEKERTRIALDMHDDLGAGLSTLRFLSEKVKRNSFSEVTRLDADKIVVNSNELVQKMNEIIWAMNEKNDTLEHLVFYTRSYAMEFCEEHQLQCEIQMPEKIPHHFVSGEVRRNVFLTVKESLHNVVKHAEAGKVEIRFAIDKSLSILIHDDGQGFGSIGNGDVGNGLRNMQKRIESIGGVFKITDEKGITLELAVPI